MPNQNLTPEEIEEIQNIQIVQETLITNFGELEIQIQSLELQKEKLIDQLEKYTTQEQDLAIKLSTKYGNGTINIEKGIFQS